MRSDKINPSPNLLQRPLQVIRQRRLELGPFTGGGQSETQPGGVKELPVQVFGLHPVSGVAHHRKPDGRQVNPRGIRLPAGEQLSGDDLVAFRKRQREIDALRDRATGPVLQASTQRVDGAAATSSSGTSA